jgi:TonB family protein
MRSLTTAIAVSPMQVLAILLFLGPAGAGTALGEPTSFEAPKPRSSNVRPAYPHQHGVIHEPGTVTLRFMVDRDGSVRDPEVVDGPEPFASAALRAVTRWKYEPAREGGQAISTAWETRFRFELPPQERDRWQTYRRPAPHGASTATAIGSVVSRPR